MPPTQASGPPSKLPSGRAGTLSRHVLPAFSAADRFSSHSAVRRRRLKNPRALLPKWESAGIFLLSISWATTTRSEELLLKKEEKSFIFYPVEIGSISLI